jgi:threonine dehydrogenase-like Zn-dependent dehydrogenase
MRAARFHAAGDIRIDEVPRPDSPGPGEVLIRVAAVGICGSDALEYRAGPVLVDAVPLTLGHEFAGEVVAVGEGVTSLREGMLVACGAGISCGSCARCLAGRTNLCTSYVTLGFNHDGALAGYCVAPASICVDAGAYGLDADTAALAQPMAIAVHATRRGRLAAGETAVVIGAGGIGSFIVYAAAEAGARVIVADLDVERLEIAAALGAATTILGDHLPDGLAPDVVFEVSGSASGLMQALAIAPRGGRIVAVGVQKAPPAIDLRRLTLDELELVGTVAHVCREDLPEALRLLAARAEGWADMAPDVLPLDDLMADGILPLAEGRSTRIKTLIDPWAQARRAVH